MSDQICIKCKKNLPIDDFELLASGKGHYKKCKVCVENSKTKKPDINLKELKANYAKLVDAHKKGDAIAREDAFGGFTAAFQKMKLA